MNANWIWIDAPPSIHFLLYYKSKYVGNFVIIKEAFREEATDNWISLWRRLTGAHIEFSSIAQNKDLCIALLEKYGARNQNNFWLPELSGEENQKK